MNKKAKIAAISILSNTSLILLKLIAGLISGSVSILSEAIHSSMDLLASIIAFFAVKISAKEPDRLHPYGHGKFENISGVLEGVLILIAAIWIIYEAILKLIHPEAISHYAYGIAVMLFSALVNTIVSSRLYKVAKETNSIALEADALHLKTDVYTSIGIALGMGLIWLTGVELFDPIFALIVAFLIIRESFVLIRKAFNPLLDARVEQNELDAIFDLIQKNLPEETSINDLRVRMNGSMYILDFVLKVPPLITVKASHQICDQLEFAIQKEYQQSDIQIHVEPKED
ncbi:MAG: cation transporter [Bacteroidales bacterium]|nr:cation transporter [Bacteroidales bacterium]